MGWRMGVVDGVGAEVTVVGEGEAFLFLIFISDHAEQAPALLTFHNRHSLRPPSWQACSYMVNWLMRACDAGDRWGWGR